MSDAHRSPTARHLAVFVPASLAVIGVLIAAAWAFWAAINVTMWSASGPSLFVALDTPPAALIVAAIAALAAGFIGAVPYLFSAIWEYTKPAIA